MSIVRNIRMDNLLQPLVLTLIAFALGYQTHSYLLSSTPALTLANSSSNKKRKLASSSAPSVAGSETNSDSEGATNPESDSEDESTALSASDIAGVKAGMGEEVKLVLVVNDSLKMQKGKVAAQAGHATLACALTLQAQNPRLYKKWQSQGQPKIALRCGTTEELESLASQARKLNLCARTIQDAGRTQVAPGSKTILGIGPGPARLINQVTGKLKLL